MVDLEGALHEYVAVLAPLVTRTMLLDNIYSSRIEKNRY